MARINLHKEATYWWITYTTNERPLLSVDNIKAIRVLKNDHKLTSNELMSFSVKLWVVLILLITWPTPITWRLLLKMGTFSNDRTGSELSSSYKYKKKICQFLSCEKFSFQFSFFREWKLVTTKTIDNPKLLYHSIWKKDEFPYKQLILRLPTKMKFVNMLHFYFEYYSKFPFVNFTTI